MAKIEHIYTSEYKKTMYLQWYNSGKPNASTFILEVAPTSDGKRPTLQSLQGWIDTWKEDCRELDERIYHEVIEKTIASKVEMITRQLGETQILRELVFDFLNENREDMTVGTATRLWLESARLERQLSGIPEAIESMTEIKDEDLVDEIVELLTDGVVDIEDAD